MRKTQKISLTIETQVLEELQDEKAKFDSFTKKPVSISKLASAHIARSLRIPAPIEVNA